MSILSPSISQAIAFKDSNKSFDVEICSLTGSKLIHVVVIDDQSNDHQFSAEHCPYCVAQSDFLPTLNTDINFSLSQSNLENCMTGGQIFLVVITIAIPLQKQLSP